MSKTAITSFTFREAVNQIVPVNAYTAKVALGSSGVLLTAKTEDGTAKWSLMQAPTWVSLSTSPDNKTATLSYNLKDVQTDKKEAFNFTLSATSGNGADEDLKPVSLFVTSPLEIKMINGGSAITLQGYNETVPSMKFKAYIGGAPATNVCFLPPSLDTLPGLHFLVDVDDSAYLEVSPCSLQDPQGGVKHGKGTEKVIIRAFKKGTLYDSPENPATFELTLNFTDEKFGTLASNGLVAAYEIISDLNTETYGVVSLACPVQSVKGKKSQLKYRWKRTGTLDGQFLTGGNEVSNYATWKAQGVNEGLVGFDLEVYEGETLRETLTIAPFPVSPRNPQGPAGANWTSTAALPITFLPKTLQVTQPAGNRAYLQFELPDLLLDETATLDVKVRPIGGSPEVGVGVSDGTTLTPIKNAISITSQAKVRYLVVDIPPTANLFDSWVVEIKAATSLRSGFASCMVKCSGKPQIYKIGTVNTYSEVNRLQGMTGASIGDVLLKAFVANQKALPSPPPAEFFSDTPNEVNSTFSEVTDIALFCDVMGEDKTTYPFGITPTVENTLRGMFYKEGNFSVHVLARKQGYADQRSAPIPIKVAVGAVPITFSSFTTTYPVIDGKTPLPISWGYEGMGDVYIQKNNESRKPMDTGVKTATFTGITAHTVFSLSAENPLGISYASPLVVFFSGNGTVSKLPPSPTVALLDHKNDLEVTWNPSKINGSFDAYSHWDITLFNKQGAATPILKADGSHITGFENGDPASPDIRRFKISLGAWSGDMLMSMSAFSKDPSAILNSDAWDSHKTFPVIPEKAVTFNGKENITALKGENITITLGEGVVADKWRIVYADKTASDWMPTSTKSYLKSFSTGGETHVLTLEFEKDYSTFLPPVKLRRSIQKSVFIMDEFFIAPESHDVLAGDIGFGGNLGFEITDGSVAYDTQNFVAFTKAIVKDELTQELKLMIGSARSKDASSVMGTMAIDVFPLPGRPHALDLVRPMEGYLDGSSDSASPVRIDMDALPTVFVGYSLTWTEAGGSGSGNIPLRAVSGKPPYSWAADNLPPGLRFNAEGTLTGTVLTPGSYPIDFSVADSSIPPYVAKKTLTLMAKSDLAVTTESLPEAKVGELYNLWLTAKGGIKAYSWRLVSGNLPKGLSLTSMGQITGYACTLDSTKELDQGFTVVAQVTDSLGSKATKTFVMTLKGQTLTLGDPDQTELFEGQRFIVRIPVMGGSFTVGKDGVSDQIASVEDGLFESGPKVVNGFIELVTKADLKAQTNKSCKVVVTDAKTTVSKIFVFTVRPSLAPFTFFSEPNFPLPFTANKPQQVRISGLGGNYTVAELGESFSGEAQINKIKSETTQIQGGATYAVVVPEVKLPKSFDLPLTAQIYKDPVAVGRPKLLMGSVTRVYSVLTPSGDTTPAKPLFMQCQAMPARIGEMFTFDPMRSHFNGAATLRGEMTAKVAEDFTLPEGLSLDARNGLIYGVPRTYGVSESKILFTDKQGNLVIIVDVSFDFYGIELKVSGDIPEQQTHAPCVCDFKVLGTGAASVSVAKGLLPYGIGQVTTKNDIRISGSPSHSGYFDVWLRLVDIDNNKRTGLFYQRVGVKFNEPLQILTWQIPSIQFKQPYKFQLQATGGIPFTSGSPYKWALDETTKLPTPFVMTESGEISGTSDITTPSNWAADLKFTVRDSVGNVCNASLNMKMIPPPPLVFTTPSLPDGVELTPYTLYFLRATGGNPGLEFSVSPNEACPSQLPVGMTLDSVTGELKGTPTKHFSQKIRFSVKDSSTPRLETFKEYTLTIQPLEHLHVESVTPIKTGTAAQLNDAYVDVAYGPVEVLIKGGRIPYSRPRLLSAYTLLSPTSKDEVIETPLTPGLNLEIVPKTTSPTNDRFLIRSKRGLPPTNAFSGQVWIVVDDVNSKEVTGRPYLPAMAPYKLYVDRYAPVAKLSVSPSTVNEGGSLLITGTYGIGGGSDTVKAQLTVKKKSDGTTLYLGPESAPTSSYDANFSYKDLNTSMASPGDVLVVTLTVTSTLSGKVTTKVEEVLVKSLAATAFCSPAEVINDGVNFKTVNLVADWWPANDDDFTATFVDVTNPNNPVTIHSDVKRKAALPFTPQRTSNVKLIVKDRNNNEAATANCNVIMKFTDITAALSPMNQTAMVSGSFPLTPVFTGGSGVLRVYVGAKELYKQPVTSGKGITAQVPADGVTPGDTIYANLTVTNTEGTTQSVVAEIKVAEVRVSLIPSVVTLNPGEVVTMSWAWSGGSQAKLFRKATTAETWTLINNGVGASGSQQDAPSVPTSYRLEVYNTANKVLGFSEVFVFVKEKPDADPIITLNTLQDAIIGKFYTQALTATSGKPPYTWKLVSPPITSLQGYGLSFDSNGVLSGTPKITSPQNIPITVELVDISKTNVDPQKTFTLNIKCEKTIKWPESLSISADQTIDLVSLFKVPAQEWKLVALGSSNLFTSGLSVSSIGLLSCKGPKSADPVSIQLSCRTDCGIQTSPDIRVKVSLNPLTAEWVDGKSLTMPIGKTGTIKYRALGGTGVITWSTADNAGAPSFPSLVGWSYTTPYASGTVLTLVVGASTTPRSFNIRLKAVDAAGVTAYTEDFPVNIVADPVVVETGLGGDFLGTIDGAVLGSKGIDPRYAGIGEAFSITVKGAKDDTTLSLKAQPGNGLPAVGVIKTSFDSSRGIATYALTFAKGQVPKLYVLGQLIPFNFVVTGTGVHAEKTLYANIAHSSGDQWEPASLVALNSSGSVVTLPRW